ncbi:ATP-binding protein [Bacteroidota bacterium]
MKKYRFNKYWFIFSTVIFIILFVFLVTSIYQNTLDDTKKNHQEQQLEMVKTAAHGIEYFLKHLLGDMEFTALSFQSINEYYSSSNSYSENYLATYDSSLIKTIILVDRNAQIQNSFGEFVPNWMLPYLNEIIDEVNISLDDSNYWLSTVIRDESIEDNAELYLIMISSITLDSTSKLPTSSRYIGNIISFNALVDRFIKPLRLSKSDFAWVLDENGRLIYHPNHKEMLFRSIYDTTAECNTCHISFDTPKLMVAAEEPSTGEYSVIGDEPPKIIAYYPIEIQNQRWVLVISTFLSDVTASLREKFRLFFVLGFIILCVIIFFSLLVYYMNSKRIRAEEATRNLEQIQEFQEQLNQASKMASIGELVDTVAHEINTPAGIIAAHADALILKNNLSSEVADTLNIIKKQTRRIGDYTKSILNYSQSIPYNPEKLDVEELINECVFLLDHRFRAKKITITKNIESKNVKVFADRRQMEQVLINLLNNSVAALETDGKITISLRKISSNSTQADEIIGDNINISVEDNGKGIPENYLQKIFDPFFSTKSKSEGTGLGLAIAKAIITRHKGNIKVDSNEGVGTIFNIYLPSITNASNKE